MLCKERECVCVAVYFFLLFPSVLGHAGDPFNGELADNGRYRRFNLLAQQMGTLDSLTNSVLFCR